MPLFVVGSSMCVYASEEYCVFCWRLLFVLLPLHTPFVNILAASRLLRQVGEHIGQALEINRTMLRVSRQIYSAMGFIGNVF